MIVLCASNIIKQAIICIMHTQGSTYKASHLAKPSEVLAYSSIIFSAC